MDHCFYPGTCGKDFGSQLTAFVSVNYNDLLPSGEARGFVMFAADDGQKSWQLEIDCNHTNWGDAHPDPKYVNVPPFSTFGIYFADLWGPEWGCYCEKLTNTDLTLDVTYLFHQTAADNPVNFPVPPGGWSSLQLRAVGVGTEVHGVGVGRQQKLTPWRQKY